MIQRLLFSLVLFSGVLLVLCEGGTGSIRLGDPCGNADAVNHACASDLICLGNICMYDFYNGTLKEGTSNACTAQDCCAPGLDCVDTDVETTHFNGVCLDHDEIGVLQPYVTACTGTPGPVPSPDSNNDNVTDTNGGGGLSGVGQPCNGTVCCPDHLVCYQYALICDLKINDTALPLVACGDTSVENNTNPFTGNVTVGDACDNTTPCANNGVCIANICLTSAVAGIGAISGSGNRCSASNCCPNNLLCAQLTSTCLPGSPQIIPHVTCSATGTPSSGQQVGPGNNGVAGNPGTNNGGSGNTGGTNNGGDGGLVGQHSAAATVQSNSFIVLGLFIFSGMIRMLF